VAKSIRCQDERVVVPRLWNKLKQADPILPEDEEKIWEAQVFGMHSAQSLQYTVFFYNCKLFGLRAFDEHRSRECEQFEIGSDNHRKYVHFIGRSNKTFKGGIKQMQLQNKDIKNTIALMVSLDFFFNFEFWCLTPLLAISWRPVLVVGKPERTTDPGKATGKLYHLRLRVQVILMRHTHSTTFSEKILIFAKF
jgi:hypothetical protein